MFEVLSFGLLMFFVLVVVFPLMICVMDYLSERKYKNTHMSKEWCCKSCDLYDENEVQEGLCSDCFEAMPVDRWVSGKEIKEMMMRNHPAYKENK